MAEPFYAEVRIWALNFAPRGWAFCNGQILPISQNTALFSIVGTTFGGDGRTTFGLPNLQGRAAMHPGNGPGLTPRRWGEKAGAETHTLSQAELPAHNHQMKCQSGNANTQNPSGAYLATELGPATPYSNGGTNAQMAASALGSTGGNQAHNNMQPFLALNFCIALTGIYPSR
jgi:microcystin-dependent protein